MGGCLGIELLLVYFVYGLSFYAMGLAMLLETGRAVSPTQARSLAWLAAFGILHGTHEWLEAYLVQAHSLGTVLPAWLDWLRLGLLAISFSCLFGYAALTLGEATSNSGNRRWHYALPFLLGFAVFLTANAAYRDAPVPWINLLDAVLRYALAVPAALLASMALRANARSAGADGRRPVAANFQLASFAFAAYALTQVFVHRLQFLPASIINQEAFLSLTDVPIQAIRAAAAVLISAGLLRAAQEIERERQLQLAAAHQARLTAVEQRDALRRDLLRHIVRSQEDERARIARELHDEIAQLLSAFSLELGALRAKLKRPDTTEIVDRLQDLARQMSQGLFHLVRDLRPSHLDNLGLVPALNFLLSQDIRPKGLDVALEVTGTARSLNGLVETALFRVAQESLANVIRHAKVGQATLELRYDAPQVLIRVCDQGQGFDPAEDFNPPRGWGLAGMRERVESLGGRLYLRSAPGQGTTVEAVIPLDDQQAKESLNGTDHAVARG